jgi:hypothetical protein
MPQYDYPEAEHYEFKQDVVARLGEELRLYTDGPGMREAIVGLERMYATTHLEACFAKCSRLLFLANVDTETTELPGRAHLHTDTAFFAGSIMAMHTILQSLPRPQRQYALGSDTLAIDPTKAFDDEDAAIFTAASEDLASYRRDLWQDVLLGQLPEFQDALVEVTTRVYADIPSAGYLEDGFMAGYLHAAGTIDFVLQKRAEELGEPYGTGDDTA